MITTATKKTTIEGKEYYLVPVNNRPFKEYNAIVSSVITPNEIIDKVCKHFKNITPDLVKSKNRERDITEARHFAMHFIKECAFPRMNLIEIAWVFNCVNHSSVIHATKNVNNLKETNKKYAEIYALIEQDILT